MTTYEIIAIRYSALDLDVEQSNQLWVILGHTCQIAILCFRSLITRNVLGSLLKIQADDI